MSDLKYMLLNLPNPPGKNIYRGNAGGFGTIGTISRKTLLPIYLLYWASALEKTECEYDVLDAQAMGYDSAHVSNAVKKYGPDVLISLVSLPSIYNDLKSLNEIKKVRPNTLIVGLGTVCTVMPEKVLFNSDVDIVIKGVYPHYNLVSNLVKIFKDNSVSQDAFNKIPGATYVKENEVVHSSLKPSDEDLNNISFEIYHKLPVDRYVDSFETIDGSTVKCIPIITGAGCSYRCMYCPYPIGHGNKVRCKSVKKIVDEVEFLKSSFDIQGFLFRDQLFSNNKERVLRLCDELVKRELDINWFAEVRADQVTKEILQKMKDAGCFRLHYGVETGSPEMLKKTGKVGMDVKTIKKTFRMTRERGIFTWAHIIIGLPGETRETLRSTLNLLYDLNPDHVNLNIITPYPGTKLFKMASEKEWISTYDWSRYTSYDAIMRVEELSVNQLSEARKEMKNKFRNFKLLNDSNYRKLYLRSLPRKIRDRLVLSLKSLGII